MPDFAVSYSMLEQVENTLNSLKSEFDGINAAPHAAVWGDPRIGNAMNDFAGNWTDHRRKLVASMDAMAKQARETRTATTHWDTTMGQKITK